MFRLAGGMIESQEDWENTNPMIRPFSLPSLPMIGRARRWVFRQGERVLRKASVGLLLPQRVEAMRKAVSDGAVDFGAIRATTLAYVSSNRIANLGPGCYSYRVGGPPLVYASAYAALLRHLYSDLESLTAKERNEWAAYLLRHQSADGIFRDPQIACPQAEEMDWWGWRHMTLHVLMALCALGGPCARPFRCLDPFRTPGKMADWLSTRDWASSAASVSNEVQNYGTLLQYARDFQSQAWCDHALNEMYDWLDSRQSAATGCWGYSGLTPLQRSLAVQTGYHFWCMYFYDRRPIRYVERIIDMCLATQNRLGGFGVALNSSACEDIDSIDPLVRLSLVTDYCRAKIQAVLERALLWVLVNQNTDDGGWVFRRHQPYNIVPHKAMHAGTDESFMAYTWFRTLSLAYLAKTLSHSPVAHMQWHFGHFPGHQFWKAE